MENTELDPLVNQILRILAHPKRLRLFLFLLSNPKRTTINTLAEKMNLPQSTVSKYINALESGGLIQSKKYGKYQIYSPIPYSLKAVKNFIDRTSFRINFSTLLRK